MLAALAGGVGGARLLAGLARANDPSDIVAVVNTGDDLVMHGLHISPDVDTVIYTLAGLHNPDTGWGLATERWSVMEELEALGGDTWFRLGDRDLATHLFRTQRLAQGATLHETVAALCQARSVRVRILPMSDQPVATRLTLLSGQEIDFQDYFVRRRHGVAVRAVRFTGAERAAPAPGVLESIERATTVIVCPSNPIVSVGPILALPGVKDALAARREDVVAVSPIVAGAALKGPADRLMSELGHESSVVGVARLYRDWVGTLVIDQLDQGLADRVEAEGVRVLVTDTIMSTLEQATSLAGAVLHAAP